MEQPMRPLAVELPAEAAASPQVGGPVTGLEYGPIDAEHAAQQVLPSAVPGRPWAVGTLAYTGGGLAALFFMLLAGDFALSMRERSVGPVVTLMLKRLSASDRTVSVLMTMLPPALSLFVGPIVSYKSDRLRGRWGRRIPYLIVPTPFAVAAMFALAYCEPFGRWAHAAAGRVSADAWSLIYFGVFWTVYETAVVTAAAVLGGLINDVVPRPLLGRFYGLFRAVSLLAGMLFNFWMYRLADGHARAILIGMGVLFGVGFTVMCLTVREGEYPPPPATDPDALAIDRRLATVASYFRDSFADPYFRWVFAAMALAAATFLPINVFSQFFARQVHLSDDAYGKLMFVTYAISLALAWPMGWLVDRLTSLAVATATIGVYAVAMLSAVVGVHTAWAFRLRAGRPRRAERVLFHGRGVPGAGVVPADAVRPIRVGGGHLHVGVHDPRGLRARRTARPQRAQLPPDVPRGRRVRRRGHRLPCRRLAGTTRTGSSE